MATNYIQAVINNFRGSLSQGADYYEIDAVDHTDRWYDDTFEDFLESTIKDIGYGAAQRDLYKGVKFNVGGGRGRDGRFQAYTSAENYIQSSDAPEYLLDIFGNVKFGSDEVGKARVEEEAQSAYSVLAITDSPEQVATVLGGYYGIDFSPIAQNLNTQYGNRFGGNLKSHTGSSITQLNEFHSFIEPILQDQIPFLMMTRGMNYQDALQATFTEDPMIQALYGKYDVAPIRQTKDGSTYLYDPFSFGEIRTYKARDDPFKVFKILASVAVAYFAPQLLVKTGAFGAPAAAGTAAGGTAAGAAGAAGYSAAQLAAATATVSAATTAVSGGDFKDILKSAGLSFAGSTVAQQLGNAQAAATPGTAEHQAAIKAGSTAAQLADNYTKAKVIYAAAQISSGAVTGNVGAGFLAAFGPDLTTIALDKVGLTSEVLDRAGVNQNLLVSGLVKTQTALARGMDLDAALATGLGQYILSGGGIAGVNKDTFFKKMGEVLRDTGEALGGGPDLSNATASLNTLYADDYKYGAGGLSEQLAKVNSDILSEEMLVQGSANWRIQTDGTLLDLESGTVLDAAKGHATEIAVVLKTGGVNGNVDYSQDVIDAALDGLSPYFSNPADLAELKAATIPEKLPENWRLAYGSYEDLAIDIENGVSIKEIQAKIDNARFDPNIGLGIAPPTAADTSGLSSDQRSYLVGNAINAIAEAMYEEDRNSGGGSTSSDEFRADAIEAYQELRDDGLSHLRVMEELGMDTSGRVLDAVRALDAAALDDLRAGDEREAYLRALGSVDETTGRYHEDSLYESGIEQAFGLYDIAKRATEAAAETGDNKWIIGTAIAIEAGADVANAFLGLAALGGIDPESTELGKTLKAITDMTGESKPEDYQKGLQDIEQRLQAAQDQAKKEGLGTSDSWMLVGKAIMGAAAENPTEFVLDFVVKEAASEVIPFVIGGAAFGGAKLGAAAAKKFGDDAAKKFGENLDASDIAVSATMLSDAAEETGGAASSGYSEGYAAKIKQLEEQNARIAKFTGVGSIPLSDAQIKEAEEFATEVARKAGMAGFVLSVVSDGALGGNELARGLFGDKTTNAGTEFLESLINRVTRIGEGAGREFMLEGLQEGGVQAVIEGSLYEIDPDRPMSASIAQNAILGAIIGGSVGGGIGTGAEVSDILANIVQKTSPTVRAAIEGAKNGVLNDAQARKILADFGITSDEYGALQTSLMNEAFDADYTTFNEAKSAFQAENPDYEPTEADILEFTGNRAEDRLEASVADLVDRSYIDAQEVIDAAAREGLTLTEEQAATYARQTGSGQADTVLRALRSNTFDPLYVTSQEALAYFTDIGYAPTQEDLAAFIGKSEEYASDNVSDYSENMLMLQLDGLLNDPNTTSEQIDRLLDRIETLNPESTAREDFGVGEDGTPPEEDTGYEPPEYEAPEYEEPDLEQEPDPDDTTDDTTDDTIGDTDGDGVSDDSDAFPDDPNESVDTDGDGVGDNTDAFPENADETTDTDGDGIGDNESGVLLDQIAGSEKRLTDRIDQLQREGKTRDEALAQAIEELAGDLGTTKEDLLDAIADSELSIREDFKDELADLETKLSKDIKEVSEDVDTAKKDLLNKIDEAEQAGIDRDAALGGAISDLAEELGITEEALLERIGESEESLRTLIGETEADLLRAISDTEAALTTEIEDVAELVGKPASEVTDADIDFVADLIAQQEAINDPETYTFTQEQLAYDVTGDGVIDQADLDLLQQAATGQDVLFDPESKFAPTGIYATQQELAQQQQQTQTQIAQEAQQAKRRDLFDQLMGAADLTGQQVTVQQSPLTQIDYLYDFGSILGPQQRAGMFPTPYGTIDRPQSRNTPSLPVLPPIPRKRGGVIDTNEELLRIIGESK